MTPATDYKLHR